ncbi:hypothetical protein K0651_11170 [Ornithinimicrobium sp. Arc0846-15]|nr:hypothetical protein [Ornithinimicrobium laminariae]
MSLPAGPPNRGQYSPGPQPSPPWQSQNDAGIIALVTGVLALIMCPVLAAPALIYGKKSQRAQAVGLADNGSMGSAGYWLGITAIIFWVSFIAIFVIVYAVFGIVWVGMFSMMDGMPAEP